MKENQRTNYVLRQGIMNLLSDEEAASISVAETAERLFEGDEYVDLNQLDLGIFGQGSDH
jgi:hypothetical protein